MSSAVAVDRQCAQGQAQKELEDLLSRIALLTLEKRQIYERAVAGLTAMQGKISLLQEENARLRREASSDNDLIKDLRNRLTAAERHRRDAETRIARIEAIHSWVSLLDATFDLAGEPVVSLPMRDSLRSFA